MISAQTFVFLRLF